MATILFDLRIDWDFDDTYDDESGTLINATGQIRFAPIESSILASRGIIDRCTLTLSNTDGRFSPLNTSSPIYASIQEGRSYHAPMYLRVSVDNGANYYRVFTGVIKIPQELGAAAASMASVTLECRSRDEAILNKRLITTQGDFNAIYQGGWNEEKIIEKWLEDAGLVDGTDFTSQSQGGSPTLDEGIFVIPWAWLDDDSVIEDIWDLAAACGGRFYVDVEGKFRYENAYHWLNSPHDTSQATLDKDDFVQLRPIMNDRELYNEVTVSSSPRALAVDQTIWQAEATYTIPAGTTRVITAQLTNPVLSIDSVTYDVTSQSGQDLGGSVNLTTTYYAQRVDFSFQNTHATLSAVISRLTIKGDVAESENADTVTATSTETFWNNREGRGRSVRGNKYIQTEAQQDFLAPLLRDRYGLPRLSFVLEGIFTGDPNRKLGDRITVNDPDVMSSSRDAFVTGITWRLDARGFTQTLECLDAKDIFPNAETGTAYFVIGTSTLTTGTTGVTFY